VVHEALCVAMQVYGSGGGAHCVDLLQRVVQHLLQEPQVWARSFAKMRPQPLVTLDGMVTFGWNG
jgi:hypothetical protein